MTVVEGLHLFSTLPSLARNNRRMYGWFALHLLLLHIGGVLEGGCHGLTELGEKFAAMCRLLCTLHREVRLTGLSMLLHLCNLGQLLHATSAVLLIP